MAEQKLPKDAQIISTILKDLGINDYEPKVVHQLLEFTNSKFKIIASIKYNFNLLCHCFSQCYPNKFEACYFGFHSRLNHDKTISIVIFTSTKSNVSLYESYFIIIFFYNFVPLRY